MPIYEYACQSCEHEFELLVQPGEKAECPKCESTRLEKLLSLPGAPRGKIGSTKMPCNSEGPPCGLACSRYQ